MADPLSWAVMVGSMAMSMKQQSDQRAMARKNAARQEAEQNKMLKEQKESDAALRIAENKVQDDEANIELGGSDDLELLVGKGSGKRKVQAAPAVAGLRVG